VCVEDLQMIAQQQLGTVLPNANVDTFLCSISTLDSFTAFAKSISHQQKWTERLIIETENQLRFVHLKPRPTSVSRIRRNSGHVRMSMALVNPEMIQKHLQSIFNSSSSSSSSSSMTTSVKSVPSHNATGKAPSPRSTASSVIADANNLPRSKKQILERGVILLQAYARGCITRRMLQRTLTQHAHRKKVANEILQTEIVYVRNLEVLLQHFIKPLRENAKNNRFPLIKQEHLKVLFPDSIEVILPYNKLFLEQLEPRVLGWSNSTMLGDIFLEFTSFMKVYTQFVKDFPNAQRMLDKKKTKWRFQNFLAERKQNPETPMELDSYLILPIQRIPRYNLLLDVLFKNTPENHPDYENLRNALDKMKETADYINERKRDSDAINKILEVQSILSGIEHLAVPSRRYVREGVMLVKEESKLLERYFFLFNDLLICAKPNFSVGKSRHSYKVEQTFDLQSVQFQVSQETDNICLICDNEKNCLLKLAAKSQGDFDSWMADLNKAQEELLKRKTRGRDIAMKRSEEKLLIWKQTINEQYKSPATSNTSLRRDRRAQTIRDYKSSSSLLKDANDSRSSSISGLGLFRSVDHFNTSVDTTIENDSEEKSNASELASKKSASEYDLRSAADDDNSFPKVDIAQDSRVTKEEQPPSRVREVFSRSASLRGSFRNLQAIFSKSNN